ncbi:MAG: glycerol-3-phosphate 1-O-acyltransferase PlsY [Candidatus Omnitrophota bacterium]|nr:glycerol-3-phosphate 1-O-acyltransferase PlsY [Candidatus Omnitrophota bacterium]
MMVPFFVFIFSCLTAYIIGSIPTGFLMTKIFTGADIRGAGSKNVGATNVYRVAGKLPGALTLVIDIFKGIIVVTLAADFFYRYLPDIDHIFYKTFLGLITILGHIYSVFLKLKGGKGVATTVGVIAALAPLVLLVSLAVWLVVFIPTNYVSLGSLAFGIALPITALVFDQPFYIVIFCVILCIINTYKHKDNIKRLLKREENRTIIFSRTKKVNIQKR